MGIRQFLTDRSVRFEYLLHRPAPTAAHFAGIVHVSGRTVAKAVLVRSGDDFVLAVLPATHQIDLAALSKVLDAGEVRIATEAEVEMLFFDCEPGAIPPFGHLYGISTVVDSRMAAGSDVVFVANTRHEGIRMKLRDYLDIETPMKGRFALSLSPGRRDATRKAG